MRFSGFITALSLLIFISSPAVAQGHGVYCQGAESTAASQNCLKRHLDSAQSRLNKSYKALSEKLTGEKLEGLKGLQEIWIAYRDAECEWEKERSTTQSLKRINELSCLARVTEDRADLLDIADLDMSDEGIQREYGSFPRWMNALAKDHRDIYWDYANRQSYDLNCDGHDEFIMEGVVTTEMPITDQSINEEAQTKAYSKDVVYAIVQNPPVGRPMAHLFRFPVEAQASSIAVCHNNLEVEFMTSPEIESKENEEGVEKNDEVAEQCRALMMIKDKDCDPKIISWTGKKFALEIKDEQGDDVPEE